MALPYTGLTGPLTVVWKRFRAETSAHGVWFAAYSIAALFALVACTPIIRIKRKDWHFTLNGKHYVYFHHWYNTTFNNERAVEIALAEDFLKATEQLRILEIGNVLSHYLPIKHVVLDKYEAGKEIIHEDIATYVPPQKFDRIVSISTIEHVGYDEVPREPSKVILALENIRRCLASGGKALITFPVDYNPFLDAFLADQAVFSQLRFMKRRSKENRWEEVPAEEALKCRYDSPFPFANALVIGTLESLAEGSADGDSANIG